MIIFLDKNWK